MGDTDLCSTCRRRELQAEITEANLGCSRCGAKLLGARAFDPRTGRAYIGAACRHCDSAPEAHDLLGETGVGACPRCAAVPGWVMAIPPRLGPIEPGPVVGHVVMMDYSFILGPCGHRAPGVVITTDPSSIEFREFL
jgi:hypothetical protein